MIKPIADILASGLAPPELTAAFRPARLVVGAPSLSAWGQGLSQLDKLICGYLLIPLGIFCLWLSPVIALAMFGLTGYGAYRALSGYPTSRHVFSRHLIVAIVLLALASTALAGVGHFFYANLDWVVRDAVLHDLTTNDWPVTYSAGASELILRAPIGYYLPAAIVGHVLGTDAANLALYAWTSIGWGLVLASASTLFPSPRERFACLLVLVSFGGMDLLGYLWGERHLPALGEHIEWWMPYIQYSSNSTLLFWVPNHAIPAWLGTILILRHWQRPELARITPLLAAAIPLWSPLAAIGLFPFFVFALAWQRDAKLMFSPHLFLPLVPIALATLAYLGMDASSVPHGWLMHLSPTLDAFVYRYALFCLIEFGILALVLARLVPFDATMRVAILVLCLLPFFYYGPGNDLGMRASIPALMVLALATVRPLAEARHSIWRTILFSVLALGAWGASQEIVRALMYRSWSPMNKSIPEVVAMQSPDSPTPFPPHYFARLDSSNLGWLMRSSTPIVFPTREQTP